MIQYGLIKITSLVEAPCNNLGRNVHNYTRDSFLVEHNLSFLEVSFCTIDGWKQYFIKVRQFSGKPFNITSQSLAGVFLAPGDIKLDDAGESRDHDGESNNLV
jgi:hypothetical protein